MKLSLELALLNIRRYPLRIIGSAVCLLLFGFALFSAVTFTRSLESTVAELLKTRGSGTLVFVRQADRENFNDTSRTPDIKDIEKTAQTPDVTETRPYYSPDHVNGIMTIESFGELDISLYCKQSRDPETLVPKAYLDEFYALGYEGFLISGRMPEALGEMIVCETFFKSRHIENYADLLNKPAVLREPWLAGEYVDFANVKIVGVFSENFLNICVLESHKADSRLYGIDLAFLVNPKAVYFGIEAYCSIDKIDKVERALREKFPEESAKGDVFQDIITSYAIERLSGLRLFIGNLMYLAAGAIAFIYLMTRIISAQNYFKEKSAFITAADAFGCTKPRILGAFAAENILLLIPVSVISAVLGCSFIRLVFNIISAYIGLKFNAVIDLSAVFIAAALMIAVEILILLISFLLFRKKSND